MFRVLVSSGLLLFACAVPTLAEVVSDDFEDGVIDSALWSVGGSNQIGFGGIGSWSHQEVVASDGYLDVRIQGPATAATHGQEAWVRCNYDYNDGSNHTINFRWGADVNANHWDAYNISITNGSDPVTYLNPYDMNGMWSVDNADNTRLYWTFEGIGNFPHNQGQQDLPPVDWSILIDSAGEAATLYQGPNLTGAALPTMSLDAGSPWYLRFFLMDSSSAGFPGTDNHLFLYDYSSITVPEPGSLALFVVGGIGLLMRGRRG